MAPNSSILKMLNYRKINRCNPYVLILLPYRGNCVIIMTCIAWKSHNKVFAKQIEDSMDMMASDANAENVLVNEDSAKWLGFALESFNESHDSVVFIGLGTKDGGFYSYPVIDNSTYDPRIEKWYTETVKKDGIFWTNPFLGSFTGKMIMSVGKPVHNYTQEDSLVGVMVMDIPLDGLSDIVNDIAIGESGYTFVTDASGTIIIHPDESKINTNIKSEYPEIHKNFNDESKEIHYQDGDNEMIARLLKSKELGWTIVGNISESEIRNSTRQIMVTSLVIGLGVLILAVVIGIVLAYRITKPLIRLSADMDLVKEGDFTTKTQVRSKDEIGALAEDFNVMVDGIRNIISKVSSVSKQVTEASEKLAATAEQTNSSAEEVAKAVSEIAQGASSQAVDATEGAESVGMLSRSFNELSEKTVGMSDISKGVEKIAENGLINVDALKKKTEVNSIATTRIVDAVSTLDTHSKDIDNIIQTIGSIADQTNLLALNAAIEAARAGEAGKGFAVVSDEIRKLAEQSGNSADEIRLIVESIQQQTKLTVDLVGDVTKINDEQVEAVNDVSQLFTTTSREISTMVDGIKSVDELTHIMQENAARIVESVENISAVSEETAAATEETSAAVLQQTESVEALAKMAEQLNDVAFELSSEVKKFRT